MFILADVCNGLDPIVRVVKFGVFPIIQIGIPIILIIMGSFDLGKAVLSSDDKEIKASTSRLIKRVVAAIAVFFVVAIVKLVMNWAAKYADKGANNWVNCWDQVTNTDAEVNKK